jgi:archaellum biogenesis ATPase FlaH
MNADYVVKMGMQEVIDGFTAWKEERETADIADLFWQTGWEFWDNALGGIQKNDTFIAVAGPSNHGKSCMLTNLCEGLLANNDPKELMILYWTIDDTKETLYTKLTSIMARKEIFKVFTYKNQADEDKAAITRAMAKMEKYIRNQTLVVKGSSIGRTGDDVKKWVEIMQEKHPQKRVVLLIDNFSNMTGHGDDLAVQGQNIEVLHDMRCDKNLAIVSTFEMNKEGFDGRASTKNFKGTGSILYRVTRTIKVYNDHKAEDMKGNHNPEFFWKNKAGVKRPIIEACLGKTKNMGPQNVGGNLYFQFEDTIGCITEIGPDIKWKTFQRENNHEGKWNDLGLDKWAPFTKDTAEVKALAPGDMSSESSDEKTEEATLTPPEIKQDGKSPLPGTASQIDSGLSHLDNDFGL